MRAPAIAMLTALLCAPALAQPAAPAPAAPGAGESVRTNPAWRRRPTPDELYAVFPTHPRALERGGRATIVCTVTTQGALRACRVQDESPEGLGFGQAALALAPQFNFTPATENGVAVESEVRLPISWAECRSCERSISRSTMLSNVPWSEAPTYAQMQAAYPRRAREANEGGRATLECSLRANGGLERCTVVREEPRNRGFGDAALALSRYFRTPPVELPRPRRFAGSHVMVSFSFPVEALGSAPPALGQPRWQRLPSGEQLMGAYPEAALAANVGGRVVMLCTIGAGGGLTDCTIESETPAGQGFGAVTLRLAPHFGLSVWTSEGLPTVGARVRIPISWQPPPPEPAAPASSGTSP